MLTMSRKELEKIDKSEEYTILERIIAGTLLKSHDKNSLFNLDILLNRSQGKPKETIDQTVTEKFTISDEEYLHFLYENPFGIGPTVTYALPIGFVDVTIQPTAVTNYDYELDLNESKRNINILNSKYVDQLEKEFKDLMN